jgi:bacterioferritin-associated ferredoxin
LCCGRCSRQVAWMLQEHLAPQMGATRGFYDV